ncbi:hypothetical protein ACHAXT_002318 [Thalassiosira profunda]
MPKLTDDDIESLSRRDLTLGFGLDPDEVDLNPGDDGAAATATATESTSPKSTAPRSLEQQIDAYNQFLSGRIEVEGADELKRGWNDPSGGRNNLASIPEDNSTHGGPWSDLGLCDYADDRRDIHYSYRPFWGRYRGRCIILITGTVALVAFVVLLAGKNRHLVDIPAILPSDESGEEGYPSDIVDRPPWLEENGHFNQNYRPEKNYRPEYAWEAEYEEQVQLIANAAHPMWFGVAEGWTAGASFQDADAFCKRHHKGAYVCPYKAYCPGGPGKPPFNGIRGTGAEEAWSPVNDDQPMWVGVGSVNTCIGVGSVNALETSIQAKVKFVLCCIDEATIREDEEEQPP